MTALLVVLGTAAIILATCALRAGPVRIKHYTPRYHRPTWPPEDVQ